MLQEDKEIQRKLLKVLQRFHNCKPKFKGDGDLGNIEFFMLIGLSNMLDVKNNRKECIEIRKTLDLAHVELLDRERGVTLGDLLLPVRCPYQQRPRK